MCSFVSTSCDIISPQDEHDIDNNLDRTNGCNCSYECAICLEAFSVNNDIAWSARLTTCPHVFHSECIKRWLASSFDCPCCRGDLNCREFDLKIMELLPLMEKRMKGRFCTKHGLLL